MARWPLAADTQGPSGTSSTDPVTWDRLGKVGVRQTEGRPRPGDTDGDQGWGLGTEVGTSPRPHTLPRAPITSFPITDRWEGIPRPVPSRPPPSTTSPHHVTGNLEMRQLSR